MRIGSICPISSVMSIDTLVYYKIGVPLPTVGEITGHIKADEGEVDEFMLLSSSFHLSI